MFNKYFELCFENINGDCITCDIYFSLDSVSNFLNKSLSELTSLDYDYVINFLFRTYRPDDEFVALIPVVDSFYDRSQAFSSYEFFVNPRPFR